MTPEGQALLAKIPFKRVGIAKPEDYRELAKWGLEDYYVQGSD
jgi:hypothetical protein